MQMEARGEVKKEVEKGDGEAKATKDVWSPQAMGERAAAVVSPPRPSSSQQPVRGLGPWSFASYGIDTRALPCRRIMWRSHPLVTARYEHGTEYSERSAVLHRSECWHGSQPPGSVTQDCVTTVVAGALDFEH